jgi:hypothetical protein
MAISAGLTTHVSSEQAAASSNTLLLEWLLMAWPAQSALLAEDDLADSLATYAAEPRCVLLEAVSRAGWT